ncbi:MAG: HupE/UreJ family protein [Pseudomonadota bacterium]
MLIDLAVDLTNGFGSADTYFQISRGVVDNQALIRQVFQAVAGALELEVNGANPTLKLEAFAWPDLTRDGFTQPWAAPMSRLRFSAPIDAESSLIRLRVDDSFPFARPIVIAASTPEQSFSRWVQTDEWSPMLITGATAQADESRQLTVWDVGTNYARQGFLHILPLGLDHILFVCALALAATTLRSLVFLVTSFTLAHSLTLSLMVLGFVPELGPWVEWAIAATIFYVAAKNLFVRHARHSYEYGLVCLFGLLHGLGFANALLSLGLPGDQWVLGLVSFNLGVEAGQLVLVGLLYPLWRLRNNDWYYSRIVVTSSSLICILAVYWMIERGAWLIPPSA